jgi:hypothetical protein
VTGAWSLRVTNNSPTYCTASGLSTAQTQYPEPFNSIPISGINFNINIPFTFWSLNLSFLRFPDLNVASTDRLSNVC